MRPTTTALLMALLLLPGGSAAQPAEFAFYGDFLAWLSTVSPEHRAAPDQMIEPYAAKLRGDGLPAAEIDRRVRLLRMRRQEMSNDLWNRAYSSPTPRYNTSPNAFLISVVQGRKPGRALDVGMGDGRNALYLAELGWDVTGFDPADQGVARAADRARRLNLPLKAIVATDASFDFGREQWDLIVFTWVPLGERARAIEGLKPGGIVVVEGQSDAFPRNGLIALFDVLTVLRYEQVVDTGDFFGRREIPIVRLVAEKPTR
jgi:SAM-dependent methyltransferase